MQHVWLRGIWDAEGRFPSRSTAAGWLRRQFTQRLGRPVRMNGTFGQWIAAILEECQILVNTLRCLRQYDDRPRLQAKDVPIPLHDDALGSALGPVLFTGGRDCRGRPSSALAWKQPLLRSQWVSSFLMIPILVPTRLCGNSQEVILAMNPKNIKASWSISDGREIGVAPRAGLVNTV